MRLSRTPERHRLPAPQTSLL
ncbi:hypothetical protein JY494_01805 [Serratia marcescens]|nr:hypothetical protein [Serratia marcescens]MBL0873855.1 hypothetical protein [Serratia nevei]RNW02941.1 hypothetical protein CAG37_024685 [Serratia nematodiphila]MBH2707458.1 hypothetical protein [Serratia marcescens]MBH2845714.1 hypothetical protein [Serratia marcescens]